MSETILEFPRIKEDDRFIEFNPLLKVEVSQVKDDDGDYAILDFDFGMTHEMRYNTFITARMPDDWIVRVRRMIEFELFHAFHHTNLDPNYSVLNWALLGNLAHRVFCGQDCGDGVNFEDWETWTYDRQLKVIFTDNPFNLNK